MKQTSALAIKAPNITIASSADDIMAGLRELGLDIPTKKSNAAATPQLALADGKTRDDPPADDEDEDYVDFGRLFGHGSGASASSAPHPTSATKPKNHPKNVANDGHTGPAPAGRVTRTLGTEKHTVVVGDTPDKQRGKASAVRSTGAGPLTPDPWPRGPGPGPGPRDSPNGPCLRW